MFDQRGPRVVVTGLGVVAANAHGVPAFLEALRAGRSGIAFQQHLADANFACQVGGIPADIARIAEGYLPAADLMAMNANMMYGAVAAMDAWRDGGLSVPDCGDDEVDWGTGAIIGTGIGGMDTIAEKLVPKTDAGKVSRLGSTMVEQIMASGASARVAGILALGNQVSTNSSACNTGAEAIISAFTRLKNGLAQRMLAGGSELAGKAAVIDVPVGRGHVVMFANNPMWRHETHGSFSLLFNAILNYDNLGVGRTEARPTGTPRPDAEEQNDVNH